MAESKRKTSTSKDAKTKKTVVKETEAPVGSGASSFAAKKEPLPPIDNNYVVQLASACHGELIWESRTTGYKVIWNEFGEKIPFTVQDLFDMRNGTRNFFVNNWVTIEDDRADEVLKLLGVDKFYRSIRSVKDVDKIILDTDTDDITEVVSEFPSNMKEVVAQRAYELREEGVLDSSKTIKAIEDATNIRFDD